MTDSNDLKSRHIMMTIAVMGRDEMDDMVSRKAVIDAVHTATYGFICGAEDGDEMTEADKLVLSFNKAVCTAIKALPSAQPEHLVKESGNLVNGLVNDCIRRQAAIDALRNRWLKTKNYEGIGEDIAEECEIYLRTVPSAQPEIIRCKDCKDYQMDWATSYPNRHYCATMDSFMPEDGFCSYAERREE